ncbi:hypothetical protein [Streptomyces sp. ISID311]|uniref:hypothetical protein n=1 Tax=Streptomyces sp. ISID311 TaxID=2601673 RepID=UPI0011BD3F7B|nr:hypothetical protein [Streptomyces sp. ISID311]TXC99974.1 hypothetical protein FS847_01655 [Streptomyces sp. ISID311]
MTSPTTASSPQGRSWIQIIPNDFNHTVNSAGPNYESVSEVPKFTIPYAGVWLVSYNIRANIGLPAQGALWIHTALFTQAGVIPGSEALTGINAGAGHGLQTTSGQTFLHAFVAGDTVELKTYRVGASSGASILNQGDGRTGVMAHWVSPGF